jgi:peptidoglycan hydrolase-like protein with peptidoglycan-binding domain
VIALDLVGDDEADARKRLHNLGYAVASDLGPAVQEFQQDYGLTPSGDLDDPTKSRLTLVHDTGIARDEV